MELAPLSKKGLAHSLAERSVWFIRYGR